MLHWTDIPIDITQLLRASHEGDLAARDALYREVYAALRMIAERKVRQFGGDDVLTAGSLLHEAIIRFESKGFPPVENRTQLRISMTRIMMSLLIDHYRRSQIGQRVVQDIQRNQAHHQRGPEPEHLDVLRLLAELQALDPRRYEVLLLKDLAELTHDEIALQLGYSKATVRRDHEFARAWIKSRLASESVD